MTSKDQAHPGFFRSVGRFLSAARTVTANVLFLLLVMLLILILLSGEEKVRVPDGAALVLKLDAPVVEEAPRPDPLELVFTGRDSVRPIELRDVVRVLEAATEDRRVAALVLDLDRFPGAAPATLRSIGEAIDGFRSSGKPVVVAADSLSQAQYYLASFADQLYLNPMGQVLLSGLALQPTYFASALDRLRVKVHVFRAGEYKSAVEPFTRDDMSEEARENAQQLVDDIWSEMRQQLAANRGMDGDTLDQSIELQPARLRALDGDLALLALESGLVDELLTRDAARNRLIQLVGPDAEAESFLQIGHRAYRRHLDQERVRPARTDGDVAIVVAEGTIIGGEQPRGTAVGEQTVQLIRDARKDDRVRAIVLRVNSPGGSAFLSEQIRRELELAQVSGIPVVVSMGALAASGGYWVGATADRIVAEPASITGSIGVFALVPTFEESLAAIGVHSDGVGTHTLSGAGNPLRPLNPALADILEQRVQEANRRFIELVARGRDMAIEDVEAAAEGRVWSGRAAHDLGLVDAVGGLDDAIEVAAGLAALQTWESRYMEEPPSARDLILERLLRGSLGGLLTQGTLAAELRRLIQFGRLGGTELLVGDDALQAVCTACTITTR